MPGVPDTRLFELSDGRELAWVNFGAIDGAPVVAFHGSPGTRHDFAPWDEAAAAAGVRLIALDRPGYGHSTFHAARSFESQARDVDQLADRLGLDQFGVVGWSSGGPNVSACARFLGDRLVGCAIVSGPAPLEADVSKEAMPSLIRILQRFATFAPRLAGTVYQAGLRQGHRDPDQALAWMLRTLPPCDVAVLERPVIRTLVLASLAAPLSPSAGRAGAQDIWLESRPWDFNLRDVEVPVDVWHGDADRNVALPNGIYQADTIPDATLHLIPGEGHWLLYDHVDEILAPLAK